MKKIIVFLFLIGIVGFGCGKKGAESSNAAVDGAKVFKQYCVLCHGIDGKLGVSEAKDLSVSTKTEEERIAIITNGKNTMTPFKGVLSEAEIKAVAAYTITLNKSH